MAKHRKPRRRIKAKRKCCKSRPRCKRCPVTCKRLEKLGKATRNGKLEWVLVDVTKADLARARAR